MKGTSPTRLYRAGAAREIVRRRLRAQRVSMSTFTRPAEVVAWLGAVQAQDYLGALWAVGLRLADACERDIERAIADRTIVRSWPMRGTLHFMAAADARWMTDLLAPRVVAATRNRLLAMGIDEPLLSRARRTLVEHLTGGRRLTRPGAYRVLERERITTRGQRGLHVLWRLAHDGLLCFGPREGKQHTFVLLEEWLPQARRLSRDESLGELARRYFTGHGPATLRDFAWWSGLTQAEARVAIEAAGKRIAEESIEGQRYWFAPSSSPSRSERVDAAHLLPAFDELFVGYADRRAAVAPEHASRVGPFDVLGPVVLVRDRLVARWKRRIARDKVIVSTAPLSPLNAAQRTAVERGLGRYARFLELDVELEAPG